MKPSFIENECDEIIQNKVTIPNVRDEFTKFQELVHIFNMIVALCHMIMLEWCLALLYFVPFPNALFNKAGRNLIRKATLILGN